RLAYEVRARPRGLVGRIASAVEIGLRSRRRFAAVFRSYDAAVQVRPEAPRGAGRAASTERIDAARRELVDAGAPADLVQRLSRFVAEADDLSAGRIRPYALADAWRAERRAV